MFQMFRKSLDKFFIQLVCILKSDLSLDVGLDVVSSGRGAIANVLAVALDANLCTPDHLFNI